MQLGPLSVFDQAPGVVGKSEFEYEQKDYLRRKKEWDKNKLEEKFHYTDTYEKEKHYGITGKIKRFFRKLF